MPLYRYTFCVWFCSVDKMLIIKNLGEVRLVGEHLNLPGHNIQVERPQDNARKDASFSRWEHWPRGA